MTTEVHLASQRMRLSSIWRISHCA